MINPRCIILLLLLSPLTVLAQDNESGWQRFLGKAKLFLDSTDVAGCNLDYVRPYKHPWTAHISLRQFGTNLHTTANNGSDARLMAGTKSNFQLKLAYRGYGFSYSIPLANGGENEFSLSKRGPVYGLEYRRYSSRSLHGNVKGQSSYNVAEPFEHNVSRGDILKRSIELNAYYIIDHKTFSYPAAITGTVRQIRSCGSPILAAAYYESSVYSNSDSLSHYWDDIRKLKIRQLSIGGGYGYNYVFGHNSCFLVHGSVMPMISFYRRNKLYTKHSYSDIEEDSFFEADRYINYFNGLRDRSTALKFTAILRGSFHYSWRDYIVGYRVAFNRTDAGSYSKFHVTITDWNGNLYLGYRF